MTSWFLRRPITGLDAPCGKAEARGTRLRDAVEWAAHANEHTSKLHDPAHAPTQKYKANGLPRGPLGFMPTPTLIDDASYRYRAFHTRPSLNGAQGERTAPFSAWSTCYRTALYTAVQSTSTPVHSNNLPRSHLCRSARITIHSSTAMAIQPARNPSIQSANSTTHRLNQPTSPPVACHGVRTQASTKAHPPSQRLLRLTIAPHPITSTTLSRTSQRPRPPQYFRCNNPLPPPP